MVGLTGDRVGVAPLEDAAALRPERASDGLKIWPRPANFERDF
jgi:hypothetical protein